MSKRRVYINGPHAYVTPTLGADAYVPAEDFDKVAKALRAILARVERTLLDGCDEISQLDEELRTAEHVLAEVES